MFFSRGAFRLPRPWSQPQTDDKQPSEASDDSSALLYDNGQPELDVSRGSLDDKNFGGLSTQEQVLKLRDVQEGHLHTWTSVRPDDRTKIQKIGRLFHRLVESRPIQPETQPDIAAELISPDEYPRVYSLIGDFGRVGKTKGHKGHQMMIHDCEYPSSAPDIGPQSISTPSLRDQPVNMNYMPTTASPLLSDTFTCTVTNHRCQPM